MRVKRVVKRENRFCSSGDIAILLYLLILTYRNLQYFKHVYTLWSISPVLFHLGTRLGTRCFQEVQDIILYV